MAVTTLRRTLLAPSQAAPLPEERLALYLRLGLAVAILSCAFELALDLPGNLRFERYHLVAATAGVALSTALVPFRRTTVAGLALFTLSVFVYVAFKWAAFYNHGWLTFWTVPIALAFGARWHESELYRWYLRATLGVVMIAACVQKLLADTYLDGTFITYMSLTGSTTERMFGFLCGPGPLTEPCWLHAALGAFIVVWQAGVGILLLIGVRALLFLFVEIGFLLGAGVYADEMNFQVLNIALLCVAFGYGMRPWLGAVCVGLLLLDAYSISGLVDHVL